MLAFLGWNPGDQKELLSMEELCENFTLRELGKSGANLILTKQDGLISNIKSKSSKELAKLQIILKANEIEAEMLL